MPEITHGGVCSGFIKGEKFGTLRLSIALSTNIAEWSHIGRHVIATTFYIPV